MSEDKTKYCPYCGSQIEKKYSVCPNCGKSQPDIQGTERPRIPRRKNPMVAAFLSLIITGAGQIYLGKIARGVVYLGVVLLISITLEGILTFEEMMLLGIATSIISAWDAYSLAKEMNE